jgi:HPt (histidine-containing phosphotransfer) domain-containing protein
MNKSQISDYPLLSPTKGIERFGSEDFFNEMLGVMVNECMPEDMKVVKSAYEDQDWTALKDIIHKIKGGASYCGADRLEYLCGELQSLMEKGERLSPELYQMFCTTVDETVEVIQKWTSKQ